MDVFVARQPIFNRQRQLYAYELLFRTGALQSNFDGTEAVSATTRLIADTLLAIGLENLLCGKQAFINFDRSLLLGGMHNVLPANVLVIEVLESVEPDAEVLAACQSLREQGYAFAMDDFVPDPKLEPLARLAKYIKVDLLATSRPDQERILQTYQPLGIGMLAEKVETQEQFAWALEAGYDYFQGYFFARPTTVRGQRIPTAKFTCLRLLAEVQELEPNFQEIQTLISRDVSLSYSLLLYVNSALFAHSVEIRSISHAMAVLGEDGIRYWAAMAALPTMAKDKPGELVIVSLVRARFCEHLAVSVGNTAPHLAFLMGLFSLLDGLTDLPMRAALGRVRAAPPIADALTGTAEPGDPYRDIYQMVCSYEAGDWDAVAALAQALKVETAKIAEAYAESTLWAQNALHATERKTNTRRHVRQSVSGDLHVVWEDRAGGQSIIPAKLMNVSVEGLQLQVSVKIPVTARISCNDPKLGISGKGQVRYCTFVKGKYLIGVEFRTGTRWRGPSAEQ